MNTSGMLFSVAILLWVRWSGVWMRVGPRNFSLLQNIEPCCRAHPGPTIIVCFINQDLLINSSVIWAKWRVWVGQICRKSNRNLKMPNRCSQTILTREGQRKSWHVTIPTSNENDSIAPSNKKCQMIPVSVAKADRHNQDEFMELQSLDSSCLEPPSPAKTTECRTKQNKQRHKSLLCA